MSLALLIHYLMLNTFLYSTTKMMHTTFLLSKQTMGIKTPPRKEGKIAVSCIILRMQRLHCELSARPPHHLFEQRFRESLKPREWGCIQKFQTYSYPCA